MTIIYKKFLTLCRLRTIRSRITFFFCVIFTIILILLSILGYHYFSKMLLNEIEHYSENIVEEKRGNIDSLFSQIVTMLQVTASDPLFSEALLLENQIDPKKLLEYQRRVEFLMLDLKKFNSNIKDLIVLDSNGIIYEKTGEAVDKDYHFYEQDWIAQAPYSYFKVKFLSSHTQDYYINDSESGQIISAAIPIFDFDNPNPNTKGTLLLNLNVDNIEAVAKETRLEKTGFVMVLDENGSSIYQPTTDYSIKQFPEILQNMMTGESGNFILSENSVSYKVVYTTSKLTNWKVAAFIPMQEIQGHLNKSGLILVLAVSIALLLVALGSFFLSSQITRPFVIMMRKMRMIEQGVTNIRLQDNSTEELEKVTTRMDLMIDNIQTLTRDLYSSQVQSKVMELQSLQSQINPHFLYNTLQSIKALAVIGRNDDISKMVTLIGGMLRYAINNIQESVRLSQELEHVKLYMNIQNYRYPDMIIYVENIDEKVAEYQVPKLILQPIVENTLLHAFKNVRKGMIRVTAQITNSRLIISITDDGSGMSPDEAESLRHKLDNEPDADRVSENGVGLSNVHHRIRMRFGESYGITFDTSLGNGTCMNIILPVVEDL